MYSVGSIRVVIFWEDMLTFLHWLLLNLILQMVGPWLYTVKAVLRGHLWDTEKVAL
jgi:hypothetical protein